ncbi:unnamed protein product [Caenorhabditis auriculariae]|uniref:Sema domain-containing protein n=1 Tax=Caenorhabditis auriculariae TaxID=2777116 RepID=A0A8S1HIK5_9PELO|nr:unnamed protein product [Caenorhabditis auriculariae]
MYTRKTEINAATPPSLLPQILLILIQITSTAALDVFSLDDTKIFHNPNFDKGYVFEKLAIDPSTTRLFVGGVNHLYDLLPGDLEIHRHVVTGPKDDSLHCQDARNAKECKHPLFKTNSYTKALAIYDKSSKLIECSNLYQGRCRLRNLHNISEVLAEAQEPRVANDNESTVVVFVGSGPSNLTKEPVLYVGTTFLGEATIRDSMAVFSLYLRQNNAFEVVHQGLYGGTSVTLDYRSRGMYKIDYVGGFESGEFAYFATRQRSGIAEDAPMQSRLVRVCTGDQQFHSYTEVPLECTADGVDYNLVQDIYVSRAGYELAKNLGLSVSDPVMYAVFSEGDRFSYRKSDPTQRSALCIFTLREIEEAFKKNIMNCFRGTTRLKQLPWFSSNDDCRATTLPWEGMKCGKDVNAKIGGNFPISATAAFTSSESKFTAIAINTTRANTVAFVGTDEGNLHKILLEGRTSAELYATENVTSNEPVLADMEFSGSGKFIYVLTPSKVLKIATSRCESLSNSCDGCLQSRDPYCGWCVGNNVCTEEDVCDLVVPHTSTGWLDFQNSKCPNVRSVVPDKIQITTADYLNVTVDNLMTTKGRRLQCLFHFSDGRQVSSEPSVFDGSLRCATPAMEKLPNIPKNQYHLPAELRIVAEGGNLPLASSNFSFYDCGRYNSCSSCSASEFPCDWCLESNECVAGKLTEDKCRKQHIVNGLNRDGNSRRKGPSKCPHIVSAASKMYVATGEKRNVSVKVQNLDSSFMGDFRCEFRFGSTVHEKLATRTSDDTITCEEMRFEPYGTSLAGGSTSFGFNVIWSSTSSSIPHRLDNINDVSVEVYACEMLATNCGLCLTLDADKFDCGWCAVESKCTKPRACRARNADDWFNSTQLCPNPVIHDFTPKTGPVGGGTKLTITGANLGRRVEDVSQAVQVANVPCDVVPEEYVPSSRIVCITGKAPVRESKGAVAVTLRADVLNYYAHSTESFAYVEPIVSSIRPAKGPRSGGTDITLTGADLDAGTEVVAKFGNIPCEVLSRTSKRLVCRIGPSGDDGGYFPLQIAFDSALSRTAIPINFEFTSNPAVSSVFPNRTIASGGIQLDVSGQGFSLLQRPRLILIGSRSEKQYGPLCSIESDALMRCVTPALPPGENHPVHEADRSYVSLEFDFDGSEAHRSRITVFPNPTVESFSEMRFLRPGDDSLTINGKDLNLVALERDILVTVGGVSCPLTALANRVLTCSPPAEKPVLPSGVQPEVVVRIGNVTYTLGELSYDSPGFSSSVYMIILSFIGAMVVGLICLVILYRRKTNTHQRQMKYLKTQMDTIEMKVATECKEAFAELQTSLNQYTADLPLGTPAAPFLEYKDYCARVLFPNNQNHPVLRILEVDTHKADIVENGLREFHKLLMNKTFFLTMVRTMESNKYFVGKDRVYVGSLLMVVLQEKMGYCTEMLKQLLRELIERTVEKKFQPKILFRRSESVAERMLAAWFTFLMYDHLTNYDTGKRLFELYWGIKQQMEKGPQDALTLEARYSLSEEKLLRATFEYKELTVFIAADTVYAQPDVPVRVLDCDTITQVKEKCLDVKYRAYRYSDRPLASELDLEWRTGVNGRMLLQDVDATSRTESGGWKKINTLGHYNVPNNSILVLSTKPNSIYNLSLLSERSEKSTMSLKNSPTMTRPWAGTNSSTASKDMDNGFKLYHLVKPTEHGPNDNQEKMVTEIYLTRLLMMKGTLQKFINDLLESIFSTRSSPLPASIKYMFDFMDAQALEHGITDPEVVHAWKSNALPLRFWVNLIKNPHFLFDISKPTKVEGCLSVVAQTLMDACSTQDHQLTKDSPSSKLLFAKDMYQYRDWVDSYYTEISRVPPISDAEMGDLLSKESSARRKEFQVFSALNELYKYLDQYKESIMDALESNEHAQASRLPGRLQDMLALMESECGRATDYESSTLGLGYNSNSRLMPRDRI